MLEDTGQPVRSAAELEALLKRVVAEINGESNARSNTRTEALEYLEKGRSIVELMHKLESEYIRVTGDSPALRKRAKSVTYDFINHTTGLSRDTIKLYARCYAKFGGTDACDYLRISDMQLLLPADRDLIRYICECRRDNPDLRREEVRELMREYQKHRV
ncbi:hypothetical protein [Paraburkholderia terrae]|nr:hypothetical protein [Paraburkholderia terrae]